MENPSVESVFKQAFEMGVRAGFSFAGKVVEKNCNHWFFYRCKKIAKLLQAEADNIEIETKSVRVENVRTEIEEYWPDVVGEKET